MDGFGTDAFVLLKVTGYGKDLLKGGGCGKSLYDVRKTMQRKKYACAKLRVLHHAVVLSADEIKTGSLRPGCR